MFYNPLVGSLKDIKLEDLISKINELQKKYGQAMRFGQANLSNQIRATLSMYQEEYQKRMAEEAEKARTSKIINDKVKVSK